MSDQTEADESKVKADAIQLYHDIEATFADYFRKGETAEGVTINTLKADLHAKLGSQAPAEEGNDANAPAAAPAASGTAENGNATGAENASTSSPAAATPAANGETQA